MSCVQLSENPCKYFYQATKTVGVWVRMEVFVRSVSINPWAFYLFYMYSIGLCTCITKTPEQILGSEYIEKTLSNDQKKIN